MTNRKLKKILKKNAIDPPREKQTAPANVKVGISRRALIRAVQVAACLLLVCAMGIGYVAMVRMVGPQGDPNDTTPAAPGFQPTDSLDVVGTDPYTPDDTTYQAIVKNETFDGKQLYVVEPFRSGASGDWFEFSSPDLDSADVVDRINLNRLMLTEHALDCNIVQASMGSTEQYLSWVKTSALTGYNAAIVTGGIDLIGPLARQGKLENLKSPEAAAYLDFSAPYWPESMAEELSINGKLYFASGKISINTMAAVNCVFADPDINSKLGINIYNIVNEGKWTYDEMYALAAGSGSLNGLALFEDGLMSLATSAGVHIADNTMVAHPSLTDGTALNLVNQLAGLRKSGKLNQTTRVSSEHIDDLFVVDSIIGIINMGEGIRLLLPMPAVEEGASYRCAAGNSTVYYTVIKGSDTALASAVMAKLAQYPHENHQSEMFGSTMQTYMDVLGNRYPINYESRQNLEIAVDNMAFTLDIFMGAGPTKDLLKNAVNSSHEEDRKTLLSSPILNSTVMSQLGSMDR